MYHKNKVYCYDVLTAVSYTHLDVYKRQVVGEFDDLFTQYFVLSNDIYLLGAILYTST